MSNVTCGLEQFLSHPPAIATTGRLGLVTNPSGIDRRLRSSVNLVADHPALHLTALFGPEHGVRGEAQAGEHIEAGRDPRTGVPVHSLYGESRIPAREMLDDIDVMVIDLQDIGARFTTYISTVAHVLDACAAHGKSVIVLDRPNPFGGNRVAGNMLDPAFTSFIGIHELPILHGLTIGEFAKLWARDHGLDQPVVVPMTGWTRDMWFDRTGLPWVFPSPNLPTLDSIIVYPGTCLLEGANLSEGRGTTRPFELIGAPWIDPDSLAARLASLSLPGAGFRPVYFTPMFSKHQGVRCGGVQIHVTDRDAFDAVGLGPWLLDTIRNLYPDRFAWLPPVNGAYFIDKLAGGTALRETIDAGASIPRLLSAWEGEAAAFERGRSDILLY